MSMFNFGFGINREGYPRYLRSYLEVSDQAVSELVIKTRVRFERSDWRPFILPPSQVTSMIDKLALYTLQRERATKHLSDVKQKIAEYEDLRLEYRYQMSLSQSKLVRPLNPSLISLVWAGALSLINLYGWTCGYYNRAPGLGLGWAFAYGLLASFGYHFIGTIMITQFLWYCQLWKFSCPEKLREIKLMTGILVFMFLSSWQMSPIFALRGLPGFKLFQSNGADWFILSCLTLLLGVIQVMTCASTARNAWRIAKEKVREVEALERKVGRIIPILWILRERYSGLEAGIKAGKKNLRKQRRLRRDLERFNAMRFSKIVRLKFALGLR
jgi:hypothetical protein